jgi:hypothetical protein
LNADLGLCRSLPSDQFPCRSVPVPANGLPGCGSPWIAGVRRFRVQGCRGVVTTAVRADPFDGAAGVDLVRCREPGLPPTVSLEPVMQPAERHHVAQARTSTLPVWTHVVHVAAVCRSRAIREAARPVYEDDPVDQRLPQRVGPAPVRTPGVVAGPVISRQPLRCGHSLPAGRRHHGRCIRQGDHGVGGGFGSYGAGESGRHWAGA